MLGDKICVGGASLQDPVEEPALEKCTTGCCKKIFLRKAP